MTTANQQVNKAFNFTNIITNEQGETLQHLGARSLLWHVGGAIARHPQLVNYGATRQELASGTGNVDTLDGVQPDEPMDLTNLIQGFYFLTARLEELAEFEDYDTRTGAPTKPFAWYNIPTIESYIRNFHSYRTNRVNTARQDQAKALGIKTVIPLTDTTTEAENLSLHAIASMVGFNESCVAGTFENLEEALADMKIDPLYIIHQSAVSMLDRAKASLMAGKAGYIDPEILAFARWTCRPRQGLQMPND
jgi:hypothetical protein